MSRNTLRTAGALMTVAMMTASAAATPVNSGGPTIIDRKNFIPLRKHVPLPGTVIGVLVPDAQAVLALEGRTGPPDQLVFSCGGGSYRWMYVQVKANALIPRLDVPVGTKGEKKRFENLNLATPATLREFGIDGRYALVEVEVNGGLGAPAGDSFVATSIRRLDGTRAFPRKLDEVIGDLQRRYQDQERERSRETDAALEKAGAAALKGKKPTGPRERIDIAFATWLPDSNRLRVHFRSTLTDGRFEYENGINIEFGVKRTFAINQAVPTYQANRLPNGLRNGTLYGVEFGTAYELSATGKVERTLPLPIESFQREVKSPGVFGSGGVSTRKAMMPQFPAPPRTAIKR